MGRKPAKRDLLDKKREHKHAKCSDSLFSFEKGEKDTSAAFEEAIDLECDEEALV